MNSSGDSQSGSVFGAANISSGYVSCIEIDGKPILPPIMTESRRAEMRRYRELAIRIETTRQFNKRQRKEIQSQYQQLHVDSDSDQMDNNTSFTKAPTSIPGPTATVNNLPLNTTVTFNIVTSPISTPTPISPPVSLSSTYTKSPVEGGFGYCSPSEMVTGIDIEIGGGISVLPSSSTPAMSIHSNSNVQNEKLVQQQIKSSTPRKLPVPVPVRSQVLRQQLQNTLHKAQEHATNVQQILQKQHSIQSAQSQLPLVDNNLGTDDVDPDPDPAEAKDHEYDHHFVIKKAHYGPSQSESQKQKQRETHLSQNQTANEMTGDTNEEEGNTNDTIPGPNTANSQSSDSNNSSSSSTSETQIQQILDYSSATSGSLTFTKNDSSRFEDGLIFLESEERQEYFQNDEPHGNNLDQDNVEIDNIIEDDRSETMSMVSLDTEEEQIRQAIVLGHDHDQCQLRDKQNRIKIQPKALRTPNPFVTTRIRTPLQQREQITQAPSTHTHSQEQNQDLLHNRNAKSDSSSDSDNVNSLEDYSSQPPGLDLPESSISTSTSTVSGRSSTETFIIERHGHASTTASSDETGTGTDDSNSNMDKESAVAGTGTGATYRNLDHDKDAISEESESELQNQTRNQNKNGNESKRIRRGQRKYYFSPIEGEQNNDSLVMDGTTHSSSTLFNSSLDQDFAPSTVRTKKGYFNSPSPGPSPSTFKSKSNQVQAPVPIPFQGYGNETEMDETETIKTVSTKTKTSVQLTEVSFVTSIGSSSSSVPASPSSNFKNGERELILSHRQSVSQGRLQSTFESPTKLTSNLKSPSPAASGSPRSENSQQHYYYSQRQQSQQTIPQSQKSGIPQFQNLVLAAPAPAPAPAPVMSPISGSNHKQKSTSKKYYFSSPEADDVNHDMVTNTKAITVEENLKSPNSCNSTLKNNTFNYSADHSSTSSVSVNSPNSIGNGSSIGSKKFEVATTPTPTKSSKTLPGGGVSKIPLSPSKLNTMHNFTSPPPPPTSLPLSNMASPISQHQPYSMDGNGNFSKSNRIPVGIGTGTGTGINSTPRTLRTPPKHKPIKTSKSQVPNPSPCQSENSNTHEYELQLHHYQHQLVTSTAPVLRSPPIKSLSVPCDYAETRQSHPEDLYQDHYYPSQSYMSPMSSPHKFQNQNQPPSSAASSTSSSAVGRVNLTTLQTAMQTMSPSFLKVPPDARSPLLKGIVLLDPLFRPKRELRIPPEALDPSMQPVFARVTAAARGYLVRRLLRTEKIQMIIQTIRDTVELVLKLYEEVPQLRVRGGVGMNNVRHEDAELCRRLFQQLTGACSSFHDVFFKITPAQRMAIIAQDREKIRAKELKHYFSRSRSYRGHGGGGGGSSSTNNGTTFNSSSQAKTRQGQHHSRTSVSSSSKRKISTATVKCLERRMSALHS